MKQIKKKASEQISRLLQMAMKAKSCADRERYIEKLNKVLFQEYCMKNYLQECEPEYCAYKLAGDCEYIAMLKRIYKQCKINVPRRSIG